MAETVNFTGSQGVLCRSCSLNLGLGLGLRLGMGKWAVIGVVMPSGETRFGVYSLPALATIARANSMRWATCPLQKFWSWCHPPAPFCGDHPYGFASYIDIRSMSLSLPRSIRKPTQVESTAQKCVGQANFQGVFV